MYRQYLVQWPTGTVPMWFERFMKDFRRALLLHLIRQHAADEPPPHDPGAITFQIPTGPQLSERAGKALAAINGETPLPLRHRGHWQAFYYHDQGCPARDGKTKCTCRELLVECHPISDEKAAKLRADDTLYDNYTVMET